MNSLYRLPTASSYAIFNGYTQSRTYPGLFLGKGRRLHRNFKKHIKKFVSVHFVTFLWAETNVKGGSNLVNLLDTALLIAGIHASRVNKIPPASPKISLQYFMFQKRYILCSFFSSRECSLDRHWDKTPSIQVHQEGTFEFAADCN